MANQGGRALGNQGGGGGASVSGAGVVGVGGGMNRFNSLARQTSIYSLTLDEFQNAIEPGKHFGSMNMDEFLKNIWTVEESQAMAAAMGVGGSGGGVGEGNNVGGSALGRQTSLQRQPSLSLPRTLSRKTVDEVWRDIHNDSGGEGSKGGVEAQATFGEMTLEDFLLKAGVVRDGVEPAPLAFNSFSYSGGAVERGNDVQDTGGPGAPTLSLSPANGLSQQAAMDAYKSAQQQQADWMRSIATQQAQAQAQAQAHQQQMQMLQPAPAAYKRGYGLPITGLGPLGMGYGPAASPPSPSGEVSMNLSPSGNYMMDGSLRGRKRGIDGPVEKVVERRQRRMIKNRESAARSRARKQAYTVELEAEVTQLKEENTRLRKKQEEEAERRKRLILENMTRAHSLNPSRKLRRTRTGPW